MKNLILVSFVFVFSFAGITERSLKDISSITKNAEGKFDVVCGDNSVEVIEEHDLMADNLCPHVKFDPNRVDILFVIDDSGSMAQHQSKLVAHAGLIIEKLQILGYDYQISVTTTDATNKSTGFYNKSGYEVLSKNTPDLRLAMEKNFTVGTQGSATEQGFKQSKYALENFVSSGFFRLNSKLHIIFMGDEGDQSLMPVSDYKKFLDRLTYSTSVEQKYEVTVINIFSEQCNNQIKGIGSSMNPVKRERRLLSLVNGREIDLCDKVFNLF